MSEFSSLQPDNHELAQQESNLPEQRRFDEFEPRKRDSHRMLGTAKRMATNQYNEFAYIYDSWSMDRMVQWRADTLNALRTIARTATLMNLDAKSLFSNSPSNAQGKFVEKDRDYLMDFIEGKYSSVERFHPFNSPDLLHSTPLEHNAYALWEKIRRGEESEEVSQLVSDLETKVFQLKGRRENFKEYNTCLIELTKIKLLQRKFNDARNYYHRVTQETYRPFIIAQFAYIKWLEEQQQRTNEVSPSDAPASNGGEVTPTLTLADFTPERLAEAEKDWQAMLNEVQQEANTNAHLVVASQEYDEMIREAHEEEFRKALRPEEVLEGQEEVGMTEEIHDEFSHDPTLPPKENES